MSNSSFFFQPEVIPQQVRNFVKLTLFGAVLGFSLTLSPQPAAAKAQAEKIQKITKAPKATSDEVHMDDGSHPSDADHAKAPINKPRVTSEPAPGTSAKASAPQGHDTGHGEAKAGVAPEQSLKWLMNGNTRYVTKSFRADGRSADDRKRLLAGQHPHAIILSCADSRVPPETVFDQALGEIFTIRVAGEALDSSVIASVEYAVEHLGPRLLVVMGHTQCGAVDTALKVKEGDSAGSEALDKLLADIRPRLKSVGGEKSSANLEVESTVNADGVARDLVRRSEIVRKKVESGELVIKPALYRMDSGKVSFY